MNASWQTHAVLEPSAPTQTVASGANVQLVLTEMLTRQDAQTQTSARGAHAVRAPCAATSQEVSGAPALLVSGEMPGLNV